MKIKKFLIILLGILAVTCFAFACNDPTNPDDGKNNQTVADITINNGFEADGSEKLIEGSAGAEISLNKNQAFVNTGNGSLKISVKHAPVPKFAFSDRLIEKDISDCDYLSFWVYLDGEVPVSLSNTANDGTYQGTTVINRYYIKESIQPKTWTKIKITKGDAFFDNMMYHLPYGKFILCGIGENLNAPLDYDFYIDDVRVYKKGMTGETELFAVDSDGEVTNTLPDGAVGRKYEVPKIIVLGSDGSELFGETVNVSVIAPDGSVTTITDGEFITNKAGVYTLNATCLKDGFTGKYNNTFNVKFVEIEDENTETATVGESYSVPELNLSDPFDKTALDGATVTVKVFNGKNQEVALKDGKFTPNIADCYTIEYLIEKNQSDTKNSEVYKKFVWASEISGLISDFSSDESATIFVSADGSSTLKESEAVAKYSVDGQGKSLLMEINGVAYPTFTFGNKFPYGKIANTEIEYVSFWIYNDSETDLYITNSGNQLDRQLLVSKLWNRAVFYSDNFSDSFNLKNSTFTVYSANEAGERLNVSLYFDDLRAIKEGCAEESDFSVSITENDYNEITGEGVRFALNGTYTADVRVYAFGDDTEAIGKASILSLKDSNGANVPVKNGVFTPVREGWHIIELYYRNDGIDNSVTKKFFVRPQLEFNPGVDQRDAVMPYGEAETKYDTSEYKPVLWNKGSIAEEKDVRFSISVVGANGKKVETDGMSFTPAKKGLYTVTFYAQDSETKEFASYVVKLGVFEKGKVGVAYDFEDGDISAIKSTYYWYGRVSDAVITDEEVGGNVTKKAKIEVTKESANGKTAHEPMFYITESNILQNISLTKSFSFDVYIKDVDNRSFNLAKVLYYDWNSQGKAKVNQGTLRQKVKSNEWVTITVERKDYEKVLGGYVFGGCTLSLGGQAWTEIDDRLITSFFLVDSSGYKECGGITIYLDNFRVEV